ncbi:MAG: hypothetical protein ABIO38_01725 [Luteimonas sp.]
MTDENQARPQPGQEYDQNRLDPAFFSCVDTLPELAYQRAHEPELKRIRMATLFAAARFNARGSLGNVTNAAEQRKDFLDDMSTVYGSMPSQYPDGLGAERGINVRVPELADDYADIGVACQGSAQPGGE